MVLGERGKGGRDVVISNNCDINLAMNKNELLGHLTTMHKHLHRYIQVKCKYNNLIINAMT